MTLLKYKKIGSLLFFGIFLLLFLEIGSRLFLTLVMGRPFSIGAETVFYPEIINVKKCEIKKDDGYFDILFLGASVLLDEHSNIGRLLSERLAAKTGKNIRVHNVSTSAHSSLDSYYKYRHLQDNNFDYTEKYICIT